MESGGDSSLLFTEKYVSGRKFYMKIKNRKKQQGKILHRFFLLALAMLLFLGTACLGNTEANADTAKKETKNQKEEQQAADLKVHFLDVGQGLAVLAESNGHYMLYDGGDKDQSSFVVSYLKKQGVKTLDYAVASHYDADHLNGVIGAVNAFSVKHVIAPDYEHDSKLYTSFLKAVKTSGKVVEHPQVGDTFRLGNATVTVLAPKEIGSDSNDNSYVIKLESGDISFLLTGDAGYKSEKEMCQSDMDLECTVICPGHHGSASSTSWDFLEATVPEYAVISCGENNQYGHPAADTMEKLESMEIEVFRTDLQGTIVASVEDGKLSWDQEPCNDYTPGDEGTQPASSAKSSENSSGKSGSSSGAKSQKESQSEENQSGKNTEEMVWLSETGSKYHNKPNCGNMNPDKARQVTKEQAVSQGYDACKKCYR